MDALEKEYFDDLKDTIDDIKSDVRELKKKLGIKEDDDDDEDDDDYDFKPDKDKDFYESKSELKSEDSSGSVGSSL